MSRRRGLDEQEETEVTLCPWCGRGKKGLGPVVRPSGGTVSRKGTTGGNEGCWGVNER